MAAREHAYTEDKIKTLSSLEHIRLRTGMYIGRTGTGAHYDDGIYILLKEVIDNAVDEFIMGCGKKIDISIKDGRVTVRDYGRGIPLGKVVECVSKINTGAKYNDDVFQFSVGLNGVGTKAVNDLSSHFIVRSYREGEFVEARVSKGGVRDKKRGKTKEPDGTWIEFTPDTAIFKKFAFQKELIVKRLWHYAYLNTGLTLIFNGETIRSENGLLDLLTEEVKEDRLYEPLHWRGERVECVF